MQKAGGTWWRGVLSRSAPGAMMLLCGVLVGILTLAPAEGTVAPNVQRAQDLAGTVARLEQERATLLGRVEELNERLRGYEAAQSDTELMAGEIQASLDLARMEAGLVALRGPGIVVELDQLVVPSTGQIIRAVQDEDLLMIVNELNAAGAEAVSINGERLVSKSEIRQAGSFININTRAKAPPFAISAIGNPDTMLAAMNLHGGILDIFSQIASIKASVQQEISIPAYQGIVDYRWAHPSGQ